MKLRTRLLLFIQVTMALVLAGFSASLYLLASKYLHSQADERLEGALNTLAAAAEVNPYGVEWEPEERSLSFGRRAVEGGFLWRVADDRSRTIDGSGPGPSDRVLDRPRGGIGAHRRPWTVADPSGRSWRVLHRTLQSPSPRRDDPPSEGTPAIEGRIFESLMLSAAVSLDGVHEALGRLALVLAGLSAGLWGTTLGLGGRLCRRALGPLTAMADAAREIGGQQPDSRLPVPATGDELEDLGRSFNALLDRLQGSFERQRRFTGDASHQLRTPLTTVLGNVDLALKQRRTPEEYEHTLRLVGRKARQMRGMIEALLFLARADADPSDTEPERIDLEGWLGGFLAARRDAPRAADVRLEVGLGGPFLVRSHPSVLGDLLENLLENAGKYSEAGTAIVVRLDSDVSGTAITVSDRGIGIDEADLPHLFEPFYRSQAARDRAASGVGLGLSIASRQARSLGLSMEANNRSGGGATFAIRFQPVLPAANGTS